MKKIILLILIVIILSGCTLVRMEDDIDNIIGLILKQGNNELVNTTAEGYKYYLPRAVKAIDNSNYNQTLYSDGYYMYLYVDIISYYHKVENTYKATEDVFYSKILDYQDKTGYAEINKKDGYYFVEIMYNYAKIEAYIEEDKLEDTVTNMCYILSTIKFNDSVIKDLALENKFNEVPQKYDIFTSRRTEGNFLDFVPEEFEN